MNNTESADIVKQLSKERERLMAPWKLRDAQLVKDRSMLNIEKPKETTDDIKLVSNEPKVFYETACALVSSFPPRYRLPLSMNYNEKEVKKMNKAERFLTGVFREIDTKQMERGRSYWLRELAYWVLSGWYSVFTFANRRGKTVEFAADLWDPMNVYPEWDGDGLYKCIRSYEVDSP